MSGVNADAGTLPNVALTSIEPTLASLALKGDSLIERLDGPARDRPADVERGAHLGRKSADEFAPRNLGRLDLNRPAGVLIRSDQSLYLDSLQRMQQRHELIGARLLAGSRRAGDGPHQL